VSTVSRKPSSSLKKLAGARVLVTGAGGFIGSHVVELLCELGCEVTAFFRYTSHSSRGALDSGANSERSADSFRSIYGDIRDPESCQRAVEGTEYIFHLAAQIAIPYSYLSPRDFLQVNAIGTTNLLQAAREVGSLKRFVATSTSEVYGSAQYTPIDERHPLAPQSPYAASKVASDKIAESYATSYGLPVTIIRPFNTYGPRQSPRAVIPTIISQALESSTIQLGQTNTRRDFLYATDTARGIAQLAASPKTKGQTINLCSGIETTIGGVVDEVGNILGNKLRVVCDEKRVRPEKSEVMRLLGDGSKAEKLCGFKSQVSLTEGLTRTIEYWRRRAIDNPTEYRI
jgi:NAD dependent epimerase/dehydratase